MIALVHHPHPHPADDADADDAVADDAVDFKAPPSADCIDLTGAYQYCTVIIREAQAKVVPQ